MKYNYSEKKEDGGDYNQIRSTERGLKSMMAQVSCSCFIAWWKKSFLFDIMWSEAYRSSGWLSGWVEDILIAPAMKAKKSLWRPGWNAVTDSNN